MIMKDASGAILEAAVMGAACDLGDLKARPYDFRRPNRISRDRLLNIQAICDRACSSLGGYLSSRLRTGISVNLGKIEQRSYDEYRSSLSKPCAAFVYYLGDEVACNGVLNLEGDLSFHLIDRLFGGRGDPFSVQRALSDFERQAVKQMMTDRFMRLFADAWSEYMRFDPVFSEFQTIPEVLDIANREDPVLVLHFTIRSDSTSHPLTLCVPLQVFEEFLATTRPNVTHARTAGHRNPETQREIDDALAGASVEVTVALPSFKLSIGDISGMRPGDWIFTGVPLDRPVEIYVRGHLLFGGIVGRWSTLYGVKITDNYVHSKNIHLGLPRGFIMAKEEVLGIEEKDEMQEQEGSSVLGLSDHDVTSFNELGALELPVLVVVGKRDMTLSEIRRLDRGSKFRLDRMVGQPADILVSNQVIAQGVIEEEEGYFAVRLTSRPGIVNKAV